MQLRVTATACIVICCSGIQSTLLLLRGTSTCSGGQVHLHFRLFCSFFKPVCLQFAALGQRGLQFEAELHDVTDSAREDILCYINGHPLEPSEIKPQDYKPTSHNPSGIHSNKEGLSKVRHGSQHAFWAWCWHACSFHHLGPNLAKFL